ncbi:Plasmodium exported protein, unknown function [Plasmodium malariae]|uniref:Uncharacterized protein n=1 Tax=Plasmodium malariae TaxID=5858 RepID=A0A1A8X495_PLAMA|nr:Plasmodium exported protein, unknown function [Plasmodium malariae]SBT00087.1 Plasmodium exported protein, unknown function [Plasmodium malariae]SBT86606.1 Plasmodium exported protein, unknown function [Plasmodium malariae]
MCRYVDVLHTKNWRYTFIYIFKSVISGITCQDRYRIRYKRIIAGKKEEIWRKTFSIQLEPASSDKKNENCRKKKPLGQEKKNTQSVDKLAFLCRKITKAWKTTIVEMENTYKEKTKKMDKAWKQDMWTRKWSKYLENTHKLISSKLNSPDLSIRDKEKIAEIWIFWAKTDFNVFLNHVISEWNSNYNTIEESAQEVAKMKK